MKWHSVIAGGVLAIGLLTAGAAAAAPISYTYSGEGTGTVNGVPFTSQAYSFVVNGDTTAVTGPGNTINAVTSGTITIAGTACSAGCSFTTPGLYRVNSAFQGSTIIGIEVTATPGTALNEFFSPSSPDLSIVTAPITAAATNGFAPYSIVATSGGPVQIISNTGPLPTFSSTLPATVPTLSEWAMILFGVLLAGGAAMMVQRRRLNV